MADGIHRLKPKSSGADGDFLPADATSEVNKNATTRKERRQLVSEDLRYLGSIRHWGAVPVDRASVGQ